MRKVKKRFKSKKKKIKPSPSTTWKELIYHLTQPFFINNNELMAIPASIGRFAGRNVPKCII